MKLLFSICVYSTLGKTLCCMTLAQHTSDPVYSTACGPWLTLFSVWDQHNCPATLALVCVLRLHKTIQHKPPHIHFYTTCITILDTPEVVQRPWFSGGYTISPESIYWFTPDMSKPLYIQIHTNTYTKIDFNSNMTLYLSQIAPLINKSI